MDAKKKFPKNQGLAALKNQVGRLETKLEELNHILKNEDNWNSVVTGWIGRNVFVKLSDGSLSGTLKWIDRYTFCVDSAVISKGALVYITTTDNVKE